MFSLCTLISQSCSIGVLILCSLPNVPLSQWCINTCYTTETQQRAQTNLQKGLLLAKIKLTVKKKTKTVQLLQSDENLQLQQLRFKKGKKGYLHL